MKNKLLNVLLKNISYSKYYNKGELIFDENDKCDSLAIINEGEVIIVSYTYKGNEIIFNKLKENMMFAQSLIFSSLPYFKGKVICNKKCKISYINKNHLLNILINNNLYETFLTLISDEVLNSKEQIRILSFTNISDRLLYLLHIHDKIEYNSITSLSKKLSVSREALSKTISSLIKTQIIKKEGKCITLLKTN